MALENEDPYAVGQVPEVLRRLHELTAKAALHGLQKEVGQALETIMSNLRTTPAGFGDPDYHPKKPGSCHYHVIRGPLFVRYVVYEPERVVLIVEIRPLPDSALA